MHSEVVIQAEKLQKQIPKRNRGSAYYKKGNMIGPLRTTREAIKLNPKYAYAYLNRGVAYIKKGSSQLAIPDFQQYLKLRPNAPQAPKILAFLRKHEE